MSDENWPTRLKCPFCAAQRAEIERLREALRQIAEGVGRFKDCDAGCDGLARAALGEEKT